MMWDSDNLYAKRVSYCLRGSSLYIINNFFFLDDLRFRPSLSKCYKVLNFNFVSSISDWMICLQSNETNHNINTIYCKPTAHICKCAKMVIYLLIICQKWNQYWYWSVGWAYPIWWNIIRGSIFPMGSGVNNIFCVLIVQHTHLYIFDKIIKCPSYTAGQRQAIWYLHISKNKSELKNWSNTPRQLQDLDLVIL